MAAGKGAFADPQGVYLQVAIVVGVLEGIQAQNASPWPCWRYAISSNDLGAILADTIRQRLAVVEEVCRALMSTVGTFGDPNKVFRDLAHMRTQIDLARQAMIKSELVRV